MFSRIMEISKKDDAIAGNSRDEFSDIKFPCSTLDELKALSQTCSDSKNSKKYLVIT